MADPRVIVKNAGSSGFKVFSKVFFISLAIFVFAIIFFNAVYQSIEQKSVTPILTEVGYRFLLATEALENSCTEIIENGGLYLQDEKLYKKAWKFIDFFTNVLFSLGVIILWFKILMAIIKRSFFSTKDNWFATFTLALLFFLIIMWGFSIGSAAIAHEINTWNDFGHILGTPFRAVKALWEVIPYVLEPTMDIVNKLPDAQLNNSAT